MLDNKTTTDCRNKRIKEAKIRSFLKSVVVCFVRHLTDHHRIGPILNSFSLMNQPYLGN